MNATILLSIVSVAAGWFCTVALVIVWAVRLEDRVNLIQARCDALKEGDINLQRQVEDYRSHTDGKIDKLGDDIKAQLARIYDRLDKKVDK